MRVRVEPHEQRIAGSRAGEKVYGKVRVTVGCDRRTSNFVIGPDNQLTAYLHAAVAKDATLHRLDSRAFWIPAQP